MSYNVRTFRARSMPEALAAVKRDLGPNAVILGARTLPANSLPVWARRERVEITAAPGDAVTSAERTRIAPKVGGSVSSARATRATQSAGTPAVYAPRDSGPSQGVPSEPPALPQHLCRYYVQLVQNDVATEIAQQLVQQATAGVEGDAARDPEAIRSAVRDYIAGLIPANPGIAVSPGTVRRVAMVGPPGSGKSTVVVKLATLFALKERIRVGLLSLDMHRLGAHELLHRYADVLEVPLRTAQTISEVKEGLRKLDSVDLVLIDTPGVSLREQARFARLATLLRAARPDETHLVLPASLDRQVQSRYARGMAPLGVSRVVLTRLDEVVGLGVVLNVVRRLNLGISYLTNGQNVPNDIEEPCGGRLAEILLPLG